MLSMRTTPNHTGVKISGDYFDLDELNQAIYKVLGKEGEYHGYEGSRLRILGISYEIRHAAQGDRNVDFVFNGLHEHTKKQHGFIAPDKNIYFSVEVLWPELLYAAYALRDFVRLYQDKRGDVFADAYTPVIAKFQALVLECLQGHAAQEEYTAILEAFRTAPTVNGYAVQYVDLLNLKYIGMSRQQREKNLSAIAIKLAIQDPEYQAFRKQVVSTAEPSKRPIHEIGIRADYPENIEW